jgi:hypothetical protein
VLIGNGTSSVTSVAPGTTGNVLTSIGGAWVSNVALTSVAAGSNTQVQYNNANLLAGSANLTFDGTNLSVVNGNMRLSNAYYLSARNNANTISISLIGRNTSDQVVIDPDGYGTLIGSGGALNLNSSGNLGLSVTPSAGWSGYKAIQVGTGASFGGYAGDVLAFVGSNCYNDNTNWRYLASGNLASRYQQSAGVHQWYNAPSGTAGNAITFTQAMTLNASGVLFVGATAITSNANYFAYDPGNAFADFGHATGVASGASYTRFLYGGTVIGSITQLGTTAVQYNVTSDQRLKENIVDAPEFGSVIDSIKVRSYDWKSDGNHQRAGFVAQELVTVAPEAVHQPADPDEMMAVDYSKLVPMLVKEIQSLRIRIAQLEAK